MSHRSMGLSTLATAAACAAAWVGPVALAQQPQLVNCPTGTMEVPPPPGFPHLQQYWQTMTWVGSATCTVNGSGSTQFPGYHGTETHKWEIIPWGICVDASNGLTLFAYDWTATGSGGNGTQNWTVTAKGNQPGFLRFIVPSGSNLLNIVHWSAQLTDHNGSTGGNSHTVWELAFPGPGSSPPFANIVADPTMYGVIKGGTTATSQEIDLSNEPNDATNAWACSWDFHFNNYKLAPAGSLKKPAR